MIEEAARHAHAARQHQDRLRPRRTQSARSGPGQEHLSVVLDWLDLLEKEELEQRPGLRLATAWALSGRAASARKRSARVERILAGPADRRGLRYGCCADPEHRRVARGQTDRFVGRWSRRRGSPARWRIPGWRRFMRTGSRRAPVLLGEPAQAPRRGGGRAAHREGVQRLGCLLRSGEHVTSSTFCCRRPDASSRGR